MRASGGYRTWRLPASALVLVALGALELSARPRPKLQLWGDLLQLALSLGAGGLCVWAGRRGSSQGRAFWRFLGAGLLTWAVAQGLWTWQQLALSPQRLPQLCDFLFLASTVPLVLACVVRPDRPRGGALELAFDASLLAILGLHVYAYATLGYLIAGDTAGYSAWLNQLWYVRDAIVLTAFVALYFTSRSPWRAVYRDLLAAFALFHVGSMLTNVAMARGLYHAGLMDLPWTLPFVWIAVTALDWKAGSEFEAAVAPLDWRDTRYGMSIAIGVLVMVPVMHLFNRPWAEPNPEVRRARGSLNLVTTILVGGLSLLRQMRLLRGLERSQASREEALKRSEERFSKVFAASPVAMSLTTLDAARYLDVNERYLKLIGYERDELVGSSAAAIGLWLEPADRVALVDGLQEHGAAREVATRFRTKSGEIRDVKAACVRVEVGGVACLLGVTEDVTEHRQLEERLAQSQRMEAVGRLAGGVAHDFNNLLSVILGYSSMLLKKLPEGDASLPRVRAIQRAGERAAALTHQLLAFGRRQVLVPEVLDLGATVRELETRLLRLLGEDVELEVAIAPALGQVEADPAQVEQVLSNLAANARDAMPEGGRLTIRAANVELDEPLAVERGSLPPGRYVALTVSDTGAGMSDDVRRQVFEPFFTTKDKSLGRGLGLATVDGIVQQSGGQIALATAPGKGAAFTIYLPRLEAAAAAHAAPESRQSHGNETVLLVEDEDLVREMTREILEAAGFTVLEAENGATALRVSAEHDGPIHLLLSDVVMPGLSGPMTAERLASARPAMRVLFASGYTDEALGTHGVLDAQTRFIQKPYKPDELVALVRNVLDGGARS